MKASDVNSMSMIRNAMSGMPGQDASIVSEISYQGGKHLGYDCGIPKDPYAMDVNAEDPSQRGKRVLIGDFNKIIQLVGTGIYMRQRGATNEFDPRVVEIDKGAKSETGLYGYPNGAVIDWWNGTAFRKVICIKTADPNITGDEDGNCTVGPDDLEHGVNGTGVAYWKEIGIEDQQSFSYVSSTIAGVSQNNVFTSYARITISVGFSYYTPNTSPNTSSATVSMIFYVKPGDTWSMTGNSITINGDTFSPNASDIYSTTQVGNISLSISKVEKLIASS